MSISVVIPAFNAEKYIKQTLDSVIKQTLQPSEIIVINDGSTDETQDILLQNVNNYLLKIYPQQNSGIGVTRQKGALLAKSDYVAFLSSDDCWLPTFLEESSKFLSPSTATFTDYWRCDRRLKPFSLYTAPYTLNMNTSIIDFALKRNMFINFSSIVLPTKIFSQISFEPSLKRGEDLIFLLDTIININPPLTWKCIHKPLLYYRIHPSQGTHTFLHSQSEWELTWQHLTKRLLLLNIPESTLTANKTLEYNKLFKKSKTKIAKSVARTVLNN